MSEVKLTGLVPDRLKVRSARIVLESLEVQTDIGFHDFEVGTPQRLIVTVEIWLEDVSAPSDDDPARAWNYDFPARRSRSLRASGGTTSRRRWPMRCSTESPHFTE